MGIPAKLCTDNPALTRYGIYRLLNTGESEFVSYCTRLPNPNPSASPIAAIENYTGINTQKLNSVLDDLLPKGN
jgi:hypothetical protein